MQDVGEISAEAQRQPVLLSKDCRSKGKASFKMGFCPGELAHRKVGAADGVVQGGLDAWLIL